MRPDWLWKLKSSCLDCFEAFLAMVDVGADGMSEEVVGWCEELLRLGCSVPERSKKHGQEGLEHVAPFGLGDRALVWTDGRSAKHCFFGCSFAEPSSH